MALKLVNVLSMTLVTSDPLVVATIVVSGSPDAKSKVDSKGIYLDGTNVTVTNITYPSAGATTPDPGPYIVPLNSSAVKVKSDNKLVLLLGDDSDTINATPVIPGGPTPFPISFEIVTTNANQTSTKAE